MAGSNSERYWRKAFILSICCFLFASCSLNANSNGNPAAQARAEIQAFVNKYNRAIISGDVNELTALVAKDESLTNIGPDKGEYLRGLQPLQAELEARFKAMKVSSVRVKDIVVWLSALQDAAFVSGIWDLFSEKEGKDVSLHGLRVTLVLMKKDGQWQLVHSHASLPVRASGPVSPERSN